MNQSAGGSKNRKYERTDRQPGLMPLYHLQIPFLQRQTTKPMGDIMHTFRGTE